MKEASRRSTSKGDISMATATALEYEVAQDRNNPAAWRVEAIDYDGDGAIYVAVFTGPEAKQRAEEYAAFKRDS